jgi:hypothetical protein
MLGDAGDRLAVIEAQQERLLELVERLVPALERTAAALDRLAPAVQSETPRLHLVR